MSDDIDFLEAWGDTDRSNAIRTNARALARTQERVAALEKQVADYKEDILHLRAQLNGLGALLQRKLDYQRGELDQEVKLAFDELAPPVVVAAATDPYRGIPGEPGAAASSDDAKELIRMAGDHHFEKRFAEARVIYQRIVDEFPGSKQAIVARQQLANLKGI